MAEEELTRSRTPYDREAGKSWHADDDVTASPLDDDLDAGLADPSGGGKKKWSPARCALGALPLCVAVVASIGFDCKALVLPGLLWISLPLCAWSAAELGKLWSHWDGRVEFTEDWPALMMSRTAAVALLFAVVLGLNCFLLLAGLQSLRAWSVEGECPA
eukprot:TRINITY_DN8241_c0_g1_i1.p1 TRINITY_DN8241_c0_g1~~TRINITY_DN8241_c0_g1_i1.p1  ORF type:complete len:160 (+),score=29.49 TRINITY_DN8241_c0_g1_i1:80-559(+)